MMMLIAALNTGGRSNIGRVSQDKTLHRMNHGQIVSWEIVTSYSTSSQKLNYNNRRRTTKKQIYWSRDPTADRPQTDVWEASEIFIIRLTSKFLKITNIFQHGTYSSLQFICRWIFFEIWDGIWKRRSEMKLILTIFIHIWSIYISFELVTLNSL